MAAMYDLYFYRGYKQGKPVSGFSKASSPQDLITRLSRKQTRLLKSTKLIPLPGGFTPKTIVRFSNQMSSMIKNGISSTEALQMYAQYADVDFQLVLVDVISNLNQGANLSESFRKTGFFNSLFCETISMGETSANLDKSFENITQFYESEINIKKKVKSMMSYPIIVMSLIVIVTIVMSTFILPKFGDIYVSMGATLPMISQVYIRLGRFIVSSGWMIIFEVLALRYCFKIYKKNILHRKNIDRFKLSIPFISSIYKKILVARFSNVLSLYLKSGIQIQESMLSSAKILQNESLFDEFFRGTNLLMKGKGFYEIVDEISIFPTFYKQVVYTGERAGDLGNSLVTLADTMDKEANDSLDNASKNIGQFVIIGMLVFLLPTMLAILMPVMNLTKVASSAGGM